MLDDLTELGQKHGDCVIADTGSIAVIEVGMVHWTDGSMIGETGGVEELIERYAGKLNQARSTAANLDVRSRLRGLGPRAIGSFLIVDEPLAFSASHCAHVRDNHPELPELFVIGIDDFLRLIDLDKRGCSAPTALVSWQTSGSRLAFDFHLAELERVTGTVGGRVTATMWDLVLPLLQGPAESAQVGVPQTRATRIT